jgi:DNA-binding NarL/FixJ family response regulator
MARRTVLLVDDHPAIRMGVRLMLERSERYTVCGEAGSASEALAEVKRLQPELAILDLSMDGDDGPQLVRQLRERAANMQVLVYSVGNELVYGPRCLKAGASGYLMKHHPLPAVLEALDAIAAGHTPVSEQLKTYMLLNADIAKTGKSEQHVAVASLTDRELQVLRHLGVGRSTAEIAALLCVSPKTIGAHRENLKRKLSLSNANQLASAAASMVAEGVL